MKQRIKDICINQSATMADALKQMDAINRKLLIVVGSGFEFISLLSIGDIQRGIIRNLPLAERVSAVLRTEVTVAKVGDDVALLKERMKERRNELMPILGADNSIVDVIFWEDLFNEKRITHTLGMPVVIMAGGRGTRLKPLTNVIPKPLIPINEKTIIEDIMDRFVDHGCHRFYISVNYKAELIRFYFETLNNPSYQIEFFEEDKPLGTAGSLSLLKGKIKETFFVSNCDILIDDDYAEIFNYHKSNGNSITLVAALKKFSIPYGTVETSYDGLLTSLQEKPELDFKINSGMYVINPDVLGEIPENSFFHITELLEKILSKGGRVGVFPVSENSWIDMGSLTSYNFHS